MLNKRLRNKARLCKEIENYLTKFVCCCCVRESGRESKKEKVEMRKREIVSVSESEILTGLLTYWLAY